MSAIKFSKMVATGNDFIVIDNRKQTLKRLSELARKLCDRKFGIGADGLLLVERSKIADFKMRILNPDGTEPDTCGNGSRCIALYAKLNKIALYTMRIETKAGLLSAKAGKSNVKINMTDPKDMKLGIDLKLKKKAYKLHYINTGVPHVVCFINDIESLDLISFGSSIRYHKIFAPNGTNVNIVSFKDKRSILARTYERGVEDETLACGTGSVASAVISGVVKGLKSPVTVCTRGGDLKIYFTVKNDIICNAFLEGQAKEVFKGQIKV
ncbi:MAG: diaminopimelate epimerase [Candidatus Orphnella occulta]|nr:diaminopimelate epimerase [Candidatus Orphnella occulta]